LRVLDLDRHLFEVECRINDPASRQSISLPSWIPGSYLLREFARYVVGIRAVSAGRPVTIEKVDHGSWVCTGQDGELTVTATIHALDESVRGAWVDRRRVYFNGPCVFLLPASRETDPVELVLEAPAEPGCAGWRVATAMPPQDIDDRGFGVYRAADYDELIDHPVEIGDFASVDWQAAGVAHRLIVAGRYNADLERVAADLRQLCETQIEFFGRPAPFASYLFLGLAVGEGYGGLEHRASSSLIFRRDDLPRPGEPGLPPEYRRFLGLASHEYFHTWHIKRTKPAAFVPYRLSERNHTRMLWVFEGITSYYQEAMLLKSGLLGPKVYLQRVGEQLTRVYRTPGRLAQSLAESSFDAWDVLYKPEPHSANTSISYYTKGALVALALDLTLRRAGGSLDDVVKESWRRYGAQGIGMPEGAFEALALELGGEELAPFFDRAVRGTDDLPLGELLAEFGVTLTLRGSRGPDDVGGRPAADPEPLSLGIGFRPCEHGIELTAVVVAGPAEAAGLNPGDVVVALDRLRVTDRNLRQRLARFEAGERVTVTAFRGDELIEREIVPMPAVPDTCVLELASAASGDRLQRRRAWLGE
jgi:predicted metalloprotease with PDZ domain